MDIERSSTDHKSICIPAGNRGNGWNQKGWRPPFSSLGKTLDEGHSEQQMEQVIQASGEEHFPAGELHDLADLGAVGRVVAVLRTMLARGLRIQRAMRALHERMCKQLLTLRAQVDVPARDRRDVVSLERHLCPLVALVPITAVKGDEQR